MRDAATIDAIPTIADLIIEAVVVVGIEVTVVVAGVMEVVVTEVVVVVVTEVVVVVAVDFSTRKDPSTLRSLYIYV